MTAPLLSLDGLTVRFGGREVVTGVSLDVCAGEIVGLAGPNGAGKTTLMRAALGLLPAAGGRRLGGDPVMRLAPLERARRAAWLPQDRDVAWPLTVERLVALGRSPRRPTGAGFSAADRAAVSEAMALTDVAGLRHRNVTELSGGERARVLAARAFAQAAPLLLADEPTAGLDPAHAIEMMAAFRRHADAGGAVVVALHDLGLAARWCTRLALMQGGAILADGPPAAVLTRVRIAEVYGVEAHIAETDDGLIVQPTALARKGAKP